MPESNFFQNLIDRIRRFFAGQPEPEPQPVEPGGPPPEPVTRKVSLIIYNPVIPSQGERRLKEVMGWQDPDRLAEEYIADMRDISYGYANYMIVERIEVDTFPLKEDGFAYTGDEFMSCWQSGSGFHQPDTMDYEAILSDHDLVSKIDNGLIDEVWLMGFPYAGFYESRMVGQGAFWCNAPSLERDEPARKFVIMGFNYERGVGEMLENFGHRTESIMSHVFRKAPEDQNLWKRFIRHEKTDPGRAEVGSVHFAPNSRQDYDWGNREPVSSRADTWLNFPNLSGEPRTMDSSDWGFGDIREHHRWWFRRLPHAGGQTRGISNNWWEYIVDPNRVR